jgi:hypothetical protein
MSIGIVQERGKSQSGNPKVKIDGEWYSAGRCDVSGINVGAKIEYVFNEFGEPRNGKRPRGLEKWRPVVDDAGKPETGSTVSEADILRSVSNVVGSACAAGTVKSPEELDKWFVAAFCGFTRTLPTAAALLTAQTNEPEFDDSAELEQMAAAAQQRQSKSW